MIREPRRLDAIAMSSETYMAAQQTRKLIDTATRLQDDSEREKRIATGLCRWCYYARGSLGGAAMTDQPCAGCGTVQSFANTATDALCSACAKEHSLCRRCGGDRETRTLRRKWPIFSFPPRQP